MEIYLIRHGECYSSSNTYYDTSKRTMDPPLTERGIQQAKELSLYVADVSFDKIYCSDLKRAIQTAEIMNSKNTKIITEKCFREIDVGYLNQNSWDDYPDIYQRWKMHDEDIAYPGGENGEDVWKRCNEVFAKIEKENYNRIAIVCHGGTIRSILCGILGIAQEKRFYFGCPIENCSISKLQYIDNHFYIDTMNEYSHIRKTLND